MTQQEKQELVGACFVFAHATEELMRYSLNIDKIPLSHRAKEMWSGMLRSMKSARYYYDQFCDIITSAIFNTSGSTAAQRFDNMRREANQLIRIKLLMDNAEVNGYDLAEIERAIADLSNGKNDQGVDKIHLVPDEIINRFRLKE